MELFFLARHLDLMKQKSAGQEEEEMFAKKKLLGRWEQMGDWLRFI